MEKKNRGYSHCRSYKMESCVSKKDVTLLTTAQTANRRGVNATPATRHDCAVTNLSK
jgi:hypothetical protein